VHTIPLDLCSYEFYAPRAASSRDPDGLLQADAHLCGLGALLLDQQIQNLSPRVYASERDTDRSDFLEPSRGRQRELLMSMRVVIFPVAWLGGGFTTFRGVEVGGTSEP
jgi:hypothetical protein